MKPNEQDPIRERLRGLTLAQPPAKLRARILADAAAAISNEASAARLFTTPLRIAASLLAVALVASYLTEPELPSAPPPRSTPFWHPSPSTSPLLALEGHTKDTRMVLSSLDSFLATKTTLTGSQK